MQDETKLIMQSVGLGGPPAEGHPAAKPQHACSAFVFISTSCQVNGCVCRPANIQEAGGRRLASYTWLAIITGSRLSEY